jgi:hypothetical protein
MIGNTVCSPVLIETEERNSRIVHSRDFSSLDLRWSEEANKCSWPLDYSCVLAGERCRPTNNYARSDSFEWDQSSYRTALTSNKRKNSNGNDNLQDGEAHPSPTHESADRPPVVRLLSDGQRVSVHRPLPFHAPDLRFDSAPTRMDFVLLHRWAYAPAKRFWTFGYSSTSLARIFDAVPPRLSRAIDRLMAALLAREPARDWSAAAAAAAAAAAPHGPEPASAPPPIAASEDAMWQVELDPMDACVSTDGATARTRTRHAQAEPH